MLSINTLLLRHLWTAATLAIFANSAQALNVNSYEVDYYNDPNDYLGDLGLSNIVPGQQAAVDFSVAEFSPDASIPLPNGFTEYLYLDPASTPGAFFLNGNSLSAPGITSIVVGNDSNGLLGFGDYYFYNQFFDSPDPGFTSLYWAAAFFDSTATAIDNGNLFELGSIGGWDTLLISAQLWNANTFSAVQLLNATYNPSSTNQVPLPTAGWFFISALGYLVKTRQRQAKLCRKPGRCG